MICDAATNPFCLTQKVRHDWPISHVAMRESDKFHSTETLAQKNHEKPDQMKFVSTLLTTWRNRPNYLGLIIITMEGSVAKTQQYACYKIRILAWI